MGAVLGLAACFAGWPACPCASPARRSISALATRRQEGLAADRAALRARRSASRNSGLLAL